MLNALIIFVRNPVHGKVKTRLAAQIGEGPALSIYLKLLQHTRLVALEAVCEKFIFTTEVFTDDFWKGFTIEEQSSGDLGDKMMHAFKDLFKHGYENVLIIGSDCPGLSAKHIQHAFDSLLVNDIVIGPAKDGGYYLLGMKKIYKPIFQNKRWSTAAVFDETLRTINSLKLSLHVMDVLSDVDEASDVPKEWLSQLSITI